MRELHPCSNSCVPMSSNVSQAEALVGFQGGPPGQDSGFLAVPGLHSGLLAAPGPLPGRSWGSPGPLLTPLGSLLGSLGALRGWFCELLALLLQTPSKNRETLFFADSSTLFNVFHGSGVPESSQNRPKSLPGSLLEGSGGRLGAILAPILVGLGVILAPIWWVLGPPWP